ncbi:hypothetical protein [Microcoleus sp. CAWBG58]|nr:hypothetical protein [Microcoleus sp. CAWBG58]
MKNDRLNYLSAKGFAVCDRYCCETLFLGDRLNYLSAKGFAVCDRYYCES